MMKTIQILLCLFLCLQPVHRTDMDAQILQFEQLVYTVNPKQAKDLSKSITKVQNRCMKESLWIQKQRKKRKKEKKKVYIRRLSRALEQYTDWQNRLEDCQHILHERFSKEYQTILPGGDYNPDALIAGGQELPVYGGYAFLQKNKKACPSFDTSNLVNFSGSFSTIVENGTISAGTWAYPQGGLHLGLDVAAPMYSNLYAPANGLVLYADAPVASDNGYLGNYCGWPQGGGNTIATVMAVQDRLYGVTFAHLSNQIHVVAGQSFTQGTLLAQSGNSGNSTGPHVHIEIFQINTDLESVISYFRQGADFSFGNGFHQPATCSAIACRIRPESVL